MLTLLATVAIMAIPMITSAVDSAKVASAISDLRLLTIGMTRHEVLRGRLPDTLDELELADTIDPWGNPYQYLNFESTGQGQGQGQKRKDRFLVPINSRFDLYSMGKDGASQPPLTAKASWDDVIYANDGSYLGLASEY